MPVKEGVLDAELEARVDAKEAVERGAPRDETIPGMSAKEDEALERLLPEEEEPAEYAQGDLSPEPITWKHREDVDKRPAKEEGGEQEEQRDELKPAAKAEEEPVEGDRVGMEDSLRALRRDGWTQQMIDRFDDAELRGFAEKATKRQSDIQAKLDERARLLDTTQEKDSGSDPEEHSDAGAPDLDSAMRELEEVFGEMAADDNLGRKAASALASTLDRFREAAQATQGNRADGAMLEAILNERAKARLGVVYPKLKSDSALFGKVASKASTFFTAGRQTGEYEGMAPLEAADAAWSDAARVILGAPPSSEERQEKSRVNQAKAQGQPLGVRRSKGDLPQFKTRDQAQTAWLAARESGDTDAVKRIEAEMQRLPR